MKKNSRVQRFKFILNELMALRQEYENWLQKLPENMAESQLAEELEETIEFLRESCDTLNNVSLPLGFGR